MKIPHHINEDLKKCFSARLQKLRKEKYNSQEKFSEAMDVSVETVKKWEQGKAFPETGHLLLIPEVLDCDLDYLIGRIDYQSRDRKISQDYTGLSEKAVKVLHSWNTGGLAFVLITGTLSSLIEQKQFLSVLTSAYNYFQGKQKSIRQKDNVIMIDDGTPSRDDISLFAASNHLTECIKSARHSFE